MRDHLAKLIGAAALAGLSSCALFPSWHWEKPGAGASEYAIDEQQCKTQVYTTADGMVTQASVRRMHACLEARGWRKTPN